MTSTYSKSFGVRVLVLAAVISLGTAGQGRADHVDGRFALTGLVGSVFPMSPDYITDMTDDAGLNLGVQASMDIGGGLGFGISYENMDLGNGRRVSPINLLFMGRFMLDSRWTPTILFGPGSAKGVESSRMENLSFRAAFGLDYFVTPTLAVGPQFNYYFISHSGGTDNTYIHITGINAAITYFFGKAGG